MSVTALRENSRSENALGESWTVNRLLRQSISGQRWPMAATLGLRMGHQATEALVPVVVGLTIDRAIATKDGAALLRWLGLLALVYCGLTVCMRLGLRANARAVQGGGHELRMMLAGRILSARGGAESSQPPGTLLRLATSDADAVALLNNFLTFAGSAVASIGIVVVVLLHISWVLAVLVVVGSLLLMGLAHVLGQPLERRSAAEKAQVAAATGLATDLILGLRVLKGFGGEVAAADRYRRTSQRALGATLRAARSEALLDGVTLTLAGALLATVATVGSVLVLDGSISIGSLIVAVGLAQFLLDPLARVAQLGTALAQARASAGRIVAVLNAPYAVGAGSAALDHPVGGDLRLRDLSHGPLDGLDLVIPAGQMFGIVPADPAEAAALMDCLAYAVQPERGSVELHGQPLSTWDPDDVHGAILVAAHDAELFAGSVQDNIRAAAGAVELDQVVAAVAVDEVAASLPAGLDTVLTERGVTLSGGQRQRVALARALAADAPILVLHEPTTAVDTLTELRIAAGIRSLRGGQRTTVLISTSPALLAACDQVAVIDGGLVSAVGRHQNLVETDDHYRRTVFA